MSESIVPPEVEELARQASVSPATNDWMIVAGAGLLIGIAATAWIYYQRTHRRRHHHHSQELLPGTESSAEPQHKHTRHRRRRWGRRNPTLAQTGGLPPVRSTDAPTAQPH